jgi:hypothetical protein
MTTKAPLLFALLLPFIAAGQQKPYPQTALLKSVERVSVVIVNRPDQIPGFVLPNIQNLVELQLQREGLKILDPQADPPPYGKSAELRIDLLCVTQEDKSISCAHIGVAKQDLLVVKPGLRPTDDKDPQHAKVSVTIWDGGGILVLGKDVQTQEQFKIRFEALVVSFLNQWRKANSN